MNRTPNPGETVFWSYQDEVRNGVVEKIMEHQSAHTPYAQIWSEERTAHSNISPDYLHGELALAQQEAREFRQALSAATSVLARMELLEKEDEKLRATPATWMDASVSRIRKLHRLFKERAIGEVRKFCPTLTEEEALVRAVEAFQLFGAIRNLHGFDNHTVYLESLKEETAGWYLRPSQVEELRGILLDVARGRVAGRIDDGSAFIGRADRVPYGAEDIKAKVIPCNVHHLTSAKGHIITFSEGPEDVGDFQYACITAVRFPDGSVCRGSQAFAHVAGYILTDQVRAGLQRLCAEPTLQLGPFVSTKPPKGTGIAPAPTAGDEPEDEGQKP